MTYQELCQRILFEAQRGGEKAELANLNTESVIEAMMPSLIDAVALACAADPDKQSLLRRTHTIAMANGVGTLPVAVLTECLAGGTIIDPDDPDAAQDITFVPQYFDFIEAKSFEPRLGYWNVKGDDALHYVSPTATQDEYNTFDGNLEYTGASVPVIPALATNSVAWPPEIESMVIDLGAEWLRGMKMAA